MHTPQIHNDEVGTWAWISAVALLAIALAAGAVAGSGQMRFAAGYGTAAPPLAAPTLVPPTPLEDSRT